jgi:hypothetical protein
MVSLVSGVSQRAACSGNWLGFLPLGATSGHNFLGNFVLNPKKSHFHRSGVLTFDCIVRDAHCCGVVAMDQGFWLRMAHIG